MRRTDSCRPAASLGLVSAAAALAILQIGCERPAESWPAVADPGWPTYAGPAGGTRYSPLNQINRSNVRDLEIAWTYNTGHLERQPHLYGMVGFQVTPILLPEEAGGRLVLCDPLNRIVALDPATGEQRWEFDPEIDLTPYAGRFNCRGVTYWRDSQAAEAARAPTASCWPRTTGGWPPSTPATGPPARISARTALLTSRR